MSAVEVEDFPEPLRPSVEAGVRMLVVILAAIGAKVDASHARS